jgi:hypothetical protein
LDAESQTSLSESATGHWLRLGLRYTSNPGHKTNQLLERISVQARQFLQFVRCASLAVCSAIAIPSSFANCGDDTGEQSANLRSSPASIQALAEPEIQGKTNDEVQAAIIRRLGPAPRDVGSGLSIQQWDVGSGVLTYSQGLADFQANGRTVWLTQTVKKSQGITWRAWGDLNARPLVPENTQRL